MDLEYRRRMIRDTSLMSKEHIVFVDCFVGYAFGRERSVLCPCRRCMNQKWFKRRDIIRLHLVKDGFDPSYDVWTCHGETRVCDSSSNVIVEDKWEDDKWEEYKWEEKVEEVVEEKVKFRKQDFFDKVVSDFKDDPKVLAKMLDEKDRPLYDGCDKEDTVISCLMEVFNMKVASGWSDGSVNWLLTFLHNKLPKGNALPCSVYKAKKILCPYEMEYEKIHACPNDCILYRGKYEEVEACPVCKASRYKKGKKRKGGEDVNNEDDLSKVPLKCVWYLPIIPRIERLFGNAEDAKNMTWHCDRQRPEDNIIRHPSDGDQWKKIDRLYPAFGKGERNLRLALSTDGMNPFGNMSSNHSSWPVMLVIYNLPSYLCMKRKYVLMPLLISGPRQPGNDIDVFLAPLIEDLQRLWFHGVLMKDAYRHEVFTLKVVLLWTITDFPALGNVAGYVTKGHKACPICEEGTDYKQLKFGKKSVYMGHRKFLKPNHPYREDKDGLFGGKEVRVPPTILTGRLIHLKMKELNVVFGKKVKKTTPCSKCPWKKRSIFFDLPYWEGHLVRHCLDVMHIEKNICDSLVGTLLNIPSKTKDNLNARRDMVDMGLRPELAPEQRGKRTYLPPGPCNLSKVEKKSVCDSLVSMKVPIGYSSNISRCVKNDLTLSGLKSHDCHVLMQQLLPVAIRGVLDDEVRFCITRLCFFFHTICRKSISRVELDLIEVEAFEILSAMELYFPPSFFDIMVHLMGHLVREIRICGPVGMHWMYPFERQMGRFKGYNKSMSRPDASIVEQFVAEEVIEYCTSFLDKGIEFGVPKNKHASRKMGAPRGGGKSYKPLAIDLKRVHHYILRNSSETVSYVEEHLAYLEKLHEGRHANYIQTQHYETFGDWFYERCDIEGMDENLRAFARKPKNKVRLFAGYDINGFSFATEDKDSKSTTQSSGVFNESELLSNKGVTVQQFYGVIQHIWELDYGAFKCVVFKCKWVSPSAIDVKDPMGFTRVDLNSEAYQDDCFVLASQARQIFYVEDPSNPKWSIVLQGKKYFFDDEIDCEIGNQTLEFPAAFPDHCDRSRSTIVRRKHDDGLWVDEKGKLIGEDMAKRLKMS